MQVTALVGDVNGDGILDFGAGADLDDDGGSSAGSVYMLHLSTDGNVNGAQKLSNFYGNLGSFYTLDSEDRFGISVVSLGDVDNDGVADLAAGAYFDDDGGSGAGAVYIFFIETNGNVRSAQKLSMLYGGLNSFYTLDGGDYFGNSLAPLGDVDGDGVADLAAGAQADGDGGIEAGTAYIFFLKSDGNIKNAQKLSYIYGNLGSFYTLDAGDQFGNSIASLGDLDGDGVIDLAVGVLSDDDGSSGAGAFYIINLEKTFCESSSPTTLPVSAPSVLPAPNPTVQPSQGPTVIPMPIPTALPTIKPTALPSPSPSLLPPLPNPTAPPLLTSSASPVPIPTALPSPGQSTGSCYHHTSTVTRLNAGGQGVAEVQLVNLVKGDRVLALDQNARPLFAKVEALPHGPSAEPFVHISMAGKEKCDLKITLHHTFDACASDQNPFKHAVEQFGGIAIKAKNIKRGDCLHTADRR